MVTLSAKHFITSSILSGNNHAHKAIAQAHEQHPTQSSYIASRCVASIRESARTSGLRVVHVAVRTTHPGINVRCDTQFRRLHMICFVVIADVQNL